MTYVVNTFNKLPFLQSSLPRLLRSRKADEEVIVIDGGSTDGTQAYVASLNDVGRVDRFLSAKDQGEAHGWNRGLLLAEGELIKLISDDDVFDYNAISECRRFMEETPDVDLLWTDGAAMLLDSRRGPEASQGLQAFEHWRRGTGLLFCCGLGLLFRKSALPVTGLFNTSSRRIDAELSLRVSSGPARQAWYSGTTFVRLQNPASNAVKFARRMLTEEAAFKLSYYAISGRRPSFREAVAYCRSVTRLTLRGMLSNYGLRTKDVAAIDAQSIAMAFARAEAWLLDESTRATGPGIFTV